MRIGILEKMGNIQIEKIYAVMMAIFGFLMVFLIPPLQIPDENTHFYRTFQISEGVFRSPAKEYTVVKEKKALYFCAEIPVSFISLGYFGMSNNNSKATNFYSFQKSINLFSLPLYDEDSLKTLIPNFEKLKIYINLEKTENLRYVNRIPNTGSYSPLVYIPQALFAFLARIIFGTVGAVFYAARLGALIFTIICIYFSFKLLPEKKFLIFTLAMMPMFLVEASSCSADAVIYSVSFLSTAYILSLAKTSIPISKREIFLCALAAVSLGLAKSVYGTILFLYLLIPAERFGSKKNFYFVGIFLVATFLISALGWLHFSKNGLPVSPFLLPSKNVDIDTQFEFVKNNPLYFIQAISNTIDEKLERFATGFIGILGWLKFYFQKEFYIFYSIIIFAGMILGNLKLKISHRALLIFAIIPTILVIFLYMYTTWTPVAKKIILGFQGRYLIPVALMFFSAFTFVKNFKYENLFACSVGFFSASWTIFMIFHYFY